MTEATKEINIAFPGQILDYVDTKEHLLELFNYITNLQQENEKLKYNARGQVNDYFKDKYADEVLKNVDLKKENEKLKETIENLTTMTVCGDKKQIKNTTQYKLDIYKSRFEKANKWVNKNTEICTNKDGFSITIWDDLSDPEKLKNILNGSDENETNS